MGEGKRRSQAKAHRQTMSESAVMTDEQPTLFGGASAEMAVAVTCFLTDGNQWPSLNDKVQLVDYGRESVEVVHRVRIVGYVSDIGTRTLRDQYFIASQTGSRIEGFVIEIDKDWGTFLVKINL